MLRSARVRRTHRQFLPSLLPLEQRQLLTGTQMKFDFGSASSPVESGYSQVTAATTYDVSRGYGWSSWISGDTDTGSGSDLERDFNSGYDGTFIVDLPEGPGRYKIDLILGDGNDARPNVAIDLEGVRADTVSTTAGQIVTRSYEITADNQLSLRLHGLNLGEAFAIVGLVIERLGDDTTAPTVAARSPVGGANNVGVGTFVTATFSEPMTAATVTTSSFQLLDPSGNPVGGNGEL